MTYVVDIVLLALAVIIIVISAKKGFVVSVMEMCSLVISAFASAKLFKPLTDAMFRGFLTDMLRTKLKNSIDDHYQLLSYTEKIQRMVDTLPESGIRLANKIMNTDIHKTINTVSQKCANADDPTLIDEFATKVSQYVLKPIVEVAVFIVLFVLIAIIIRLIVKAAKEVLEKIPVVGKVDVLLGGLLGAVKALALIFVLCVIMYFLYNSTKDETLIKGIGGSRIYQFVTEHTSSLQGLLS